MAKNQKNKQNTKTTARSQKRKLAQEIIDDFLKDDKEAETALLVISSGIAAIVMVLFLALR